MLSFIYRLVQQFETEHQFRPNVVYLNREHLKRLTVELEAPDARSLSDRMGLEVMLRSESVHPQVGWLQAATRQVV